MCSDIDPGLGAKKNFPTGFEWHDLVAASYIIKIIDCMIIGGATLTFGMLITKSSAYIYYTKRSKVGIKC